MNKIKKCKCGAEYEQYNSLINKCTKCLIEAGKKKIAREYKKETKARREKLKTRQDWLKDAQIACNAYIRARDAGQPCISCGKNTGAKMNAGHYRSVGACPELRFDEFNIHLQCEHCNSYLSGNIIEYRKNLIRKIGLKEVERLEGPQKIAKLSIEEIKELSAKFKRMTKELKNESASI